MAEAVEITMQLAEGMHFVGTNAAGLTVHLDSPTMGGGAGASPVQLLLMSLAGCSGMDVMAIMRKKRQDVQALEVFAHGVRGEAYPKPFTSIQLAYRFTGTGLDGDACERAIGLSRDTYCPIWAMLRPTVEISFTYTITEPS